MERYGNYNLRTFDSSHNSISLCHLKQYWGERISYVKAQQRCSRKLCNQWPRPECSEDEDPSIGTYCLNSQNFWTDTPCALRAKIYPDGTIGIVHAPNKVEAEAVSRSVQNDTKTFFRVDWSSESDADSVLSQCSTISTCSISIDEYCVCDVSLVDSQVFSDFNLPRNAAELLTSLQIGAFDPLSIRSNWFMKSVNGMNIFTIDGKITSSSIFEVTDENGIRQLRKNIRSVVKVLGTSASFRNPVHFISLSDAESHQAQDETDAAIDHYFYHSNTAPFLALRLAQRFGVSNPSPGYISRIASTFRNGIYTFTNEETSIQYGSGQYGDLGATIASVLLDREARTQILDADPMHGSFKEPIIKVLSLMRALNFELSSDSGFVDFDINVNLKIGQMAYAFPNVFSFFLPEYQPSGPVAMASLVAPESQVLTGPRAIDFLNGMLSLIKYGLTYCLGGFGKFNWWSTVECSSYMPLDRNQGTLGKLTYSPTDNGSMETMLDELATLLTAGRLSASNRQLINSIIATESDMSLAVMKAQQLIVLTPEFQVTNIVRKSGASRPNPVAPLPSNRPYKALIYLVLDGGMDSFNMLVPHTCSQENGDGKTLLVQYNEERTTLAFTDDERTRVIDAVEQPCSQFAIHQSLEIVERLYNIGDLTFFANAGVINKPVNKDNYYELTKTSLFGHNTMMEEAQKVDPYDDIPNTGILGRMCDRLKRKGFNAQPITVQDASIATVGIPGVAVDPLLVSAYDTNKFNPSNQGEDFDVSGHLGNLNDANMLQSSLYGETWSKVLQKAIFDNELILKALSSTQLMTTFSDHEYSSKLKVISSLIASHKQRGTDRDVFFLSLGGWDHHSALKRGLSENFAMLNNALTAFYDEMKAQDTWQSVSLVLASEFSRTLTANSGEGSDHAWGGNYFIMGGAVDGGRILGNYPNDITYSSPLNIGRGRLIPTLSWESIMNAVVEWMGADSDADLDYSMPNRKETKTKLYQASEVFLSGSLSFWE
jgi:uncharacterized protein (DUF1501 family)